MRPMAALLDSEMPFVSFHSMVASMEARWRRTVRANVMNGARREREA